MTHSWRWTPGMSHSLHSNRKPTRPLRTETPQHQVREVLPDLLPRQLTLGVVPHVEPVDRAVVVVDHQVGGDVAAEDPGALALFDQGSHALVVAAAFGPHLDLLGLLQQREGLEE